MVRASFLALSVTTSLGGVALAQPQGLDGKWVVQWAGNPKNENALSLKVAGGRASGTYLNDDKVSCTVTGNVQERQLALTVVCPKWDIRMQGTATADWKTASGTYQAYVSAAGTFILRRAP
ncbi:MAG TPA: hypothetical protein VJ740_15740 [Hyphomicrobiaceae bacterium]|nr:hypothetical protein [Hyphomicrobiaceae bacterium]